MDTLATGTVTPLLLLHPRVDYRNYLKGQFIAAAQQEGYGAETPQLFEDALRGRFHQLFSTDEDTPGPVFPLLIELLFDAMISPAAGGGFGIDASKIPPQGQTPGPDYLAQLIALTGQSTRELQNRYRVSFERAPDETRSRARYRAGCRSF